MKKIFLIAVLAVAFSSCKKEEETPLCNCYEYHEDYDILTLPDGTQALDWGFDYSTEPSPDYCESETGEYIETGIGKRFKIICN